MPYCRKHVRYGDIEMIGLEQENFFSQTPFISVSLMRVKNIHSWSSNDFDPSGTNYISIITTETSCDHPLIKEFLKDIEKFLGFKICQDEA